MRCCPRSPFLSPLWAEMPYHRFGNSVVQHRAHPVETLRRMARRHSRPSPRPYMRTGRSGVRPDGVFHLGRHRHSRHAVKARRIVRTDVRAGRCYTTLLHDGIRSSRVRRDWCTQEMQLLSPGYFCWYSRTTYRATCCCGSTAGIQFRSCAVCPADHGHACRKTRCRKLYVFRGFRFRDCIGRILAGLLVKYRGYDDMFLGMLLVLLLSIVLHYLFGRRHPSSPPPSQKKRIRHEPDNA